jgi:hypothetical protein
MAEMLAALRAAEWILTSYATRLDPAEALDRGVSSALGQVRAVIARAEA